MTEKLKLAVCWASSCGGCEISLLNINEKILEVDKNFEIVFFPIIMDYKYEDIETIDDKSIFITLFTGSIRNNENENLARLLRQKSQILVAFGSCAIEGCIPGMANLSPVKQIINTAFHTESTDSSDVSPQTSCLVPEGELFLPKLTPRVYTLQQIVDVDYFFPGCPPEACQISRFVDFLVKVSEGQDHLPEKGTILGVGNSTVCDECPRQKNVKHLKKFCRIQEAAPLKQDVCILEEGVPCNGPATRSGCNARCPRIGAQCIGCYGPAEGVLDNGARLISAFASIIDSNSSNEIEKIYDGIPDCIGQFYRFTMANSLLGASQGKLKSKIFEVNQNDHKQD